MFGSNWYEDGVRRYGAPSESDIAMAMDHQRKARGLLQDVSQKEEPSKVSSPSPSMEPVKRVRKPKVASVAPPVVSPPMASPLVETAPVAPTVAPVKIKRPRKPKAVTPVKMADPLMVQKEVVLPTHMEQVRDEIDADGFEIEYVKLSVFTWGDMTYFRDTKKNKLYKKIKEKTIGSYVGRFDPVRETIHTDVPDSDDESV